MPVSSTPVDEVAQDLVPIRVRVTHRFHPLFGGEFEFVKRRRNWTADRVYVFDVDGELLSLPVEWTNLAGDDPFVVVAAGRSPFRTQDLLELAILVQGLGRSRDLDSRDAGGVARITP